MQKAQRAILFVNLHKENASVTAEEIRRELEGRGAQVTVFALDGSPGPGPKGEWDIAFSLGGDGTVLYAARILAPAGTPIFPIHLGTLGFLAGVESHEWLSVYEQWVNQEASPSGTTARLSTRCMLELSVERNGKGVYTNTCLNDIVISYMGIAKLIRLRLRTEISQVDCLRRTEGSETNTLPKQPKVDQHGQTEFADLGCYRSDGLVIATPTGSTAYSMAAGGPIVDPEMEALIISPVCPFTLSNRPLVLPSRQNLLVDIDREQRSGVLLTIDGQDTFTLEPGDNITIRHSPHYTRLITSGRSSYYSALKGKLAWGAQK